MQKEIWKDVVGYEGLYQVSSLGKVKSLRRLVDHGRGNSNRLVKCRILSPGLTNNGYEMVSLTKDKISKHQSVHRLVAIALIHNTKNKPCVNHIDCNTKNNNVENLEWCTHAENIRYAASLGRMKNPNKGKFGDMHHRSIRIFKFSINGDYLCSYGSIKEAARANGVKSDANISRCAKGNVKSASGYVWRYSNETTVK